MQIKFFKHEKHFKKGGINGNPSFFWNIMLSVALLITFSSIIFGFVLFRKINQKPIISTEDPNQKSQSLDKEKIQKVLQYFSNREKKSTDILNSPSPIVDPSL